MAKNLHAPSVFLVRDAGYYKAPSKTLLESFAEDFVEGPVLIVKWSKDEQSVVFLTNACPAEAIKMASAFIGGEADLALDLDDVEL